MSSARLPPAIDITPGRSFMLALACATAYAAAITAVLLSGLPWLARIGFAVCLAVFAAWWIATRALGFGARAIRRFVWQPEGECEWQDRRGRYRSGAPVPGVLVTPLLVVLRLRCGRMRARTLCIARDAVAEEDFRRLRMRLIVSPPVSPPSPARRLFAALRARWYDRHRSAEGR
ncbi:MAG: protein YgfX [Gammaproteobacteria bacterium]